MRKAIFLDRDGVIVHDKGYMHKPEDVSVIEGVPESIKRFNDAGFLVIVISNQAGVARGYFEEKNVEIFNKELLKQLKKSSAHIDAVYFCPHHPTEGKIAKYSIACDCRKPKAGMILDAAKKFDISLIESWVVGDRQSDMDAGKSAGCKTIFIGRDVMNLKEATEVIFNDACAPQLDSVKIIQSHEVNKIETIAHDLKKQEKRIVFTNGCFDILHFGHVYYLKEAKRMGDVLIVGLNSDKSVKAIKGKNRPLNGEMERAFVLDALVFVDYVFIFDEEVPVKLVELIKPEVYVKGSDWKDKNIPEKKIVEKYGGTVAFVPLVPGFSTTKLIEKIKKG